METKQLGPACQNLPHVRVLKYTENKTSPVSTVLTKWSVCEQLTVL